MLLALVWKAIRGSKGRLVVAAAAVFAGALVATSLLSVSFDVAERMARELRAFGANILVAPRSEKVIAEVAGVRYSGYAAREYLQEADLPKLKNIFWKHNIVGLAPFLVGMVEVQGKKVPLVGTWYEKEIRLKDGSLFKAGTRLTSPWWKITGRWPQETKEAGLGVALARRLGLGPGDELIIKNQGAQHSFKVVGLLTSGGFEEDQIFVDLARAQELFGIPGKLDFIQVGALIKPDDELAFRAGDNPKKRLPPEEFERWYCTPYLSSIIYQIEEALPDVRARAIRQIAQAEGAMLSKVRLVFLLVTLLALAAGSLGVMATATTAVLQRQEEIGLMRVLGGESSQIFSQFFLESAAAGLLGAFPGYWAGQRLAQVVGQAVFSVQVMTSPLVFPVVLILALGMALIGSFLPVRRALRQDPIVSLKGI